MKILKKIDDDDQFKKTKTNSKRKQKKEILKPQNDFSLKIQSNEFEGGVKTAKSSRSELKTPTQKGRVKSLNLDVLNETKKPQDEPKKSQFFDRVSLVFGGGGKGGETDPFQKYQHKEPRIAMAQNPLQFQNEFLELDSKQNDPVQVTWGQSVSQTNIEQTFEQSLNESFYTQKSKFAYDFEGGEGYKTESLYDKFIEMNSDFINKELIQQFDFKNQYKEQAYKFFKKALKYENYQIKSTWVPEYDDDSVSEFYQMQMQLFQAQDKKKQSRLSKVFQEFTKNELTGEIYLSVIQRIFNNIDDSNARSVDYLKIYGLDIQTQVFRELGGFLLRAGQHFSGDMEDPTSSIIMHNNQTFFFQPIIEGKVQDNSQAIKRYNLGETLPVEKITYFQLYKHTVWPKQVRNCYGYLDHGKQWLDSHQGDSITLMEGYQIVIPENWVVWDEKLYVDNLNVIFLIDYSRSQPQQQLKDYQFIDQQYVAITQRSSDNLSKTTTNLLIYKLDQLDKPIFYREAIGSFTNLRMGFFIHDQNEDGKRSDQVTFVFIGVEQIYEIIINLKKLSDTKLNKYYNKSLTSKNYIKAIGKRNPEVLRRQIIQLQENDEQEDIEVVYILTQNRSIEGGIIIIHPLTDNVQRRQYILDQLLKVKAQSYIAKFNFTVPLDDKFFQICILDPQKESQNQLIFQSEDSLLICFNDSQLIQFTSEGFLFYYISDCARTNLASVIDKKISQRENNSSELAYTYKLLLKIFHPHSTVDKSQTLYLEKDDKDCIYGLSWSMSKKQTKPQESANDNEFFVFLNNDTVVQKIKIFKERRATWKLVRYHLSIKSKLAVFFYQVKNEFGEDPLYFMQIEEYDYLEKIAKKENEFNDEALVQDHTIFSQFINLNEIEVLSASSYYVENNKAATLVFEQIVDQRQPQINDYIVPFLMYSSTNPRTPKQLHICFLNLGKLRLIYKKYTAIQASNKTDNFFGEEGVIEAHKIDINGLCYNKDQTQVPSSSQQIYPRLFARSSNWTVDTKSRKTLFWQSTFQIGYCNLENDTKVTEIIEIRTCLSEQGRLMFDFSEQLDVIHDFKQSNDQGKKEENKSFSKIQPIKANLILFREEYSNNFTSKEHLQRQVLIPEFDSDGNIIRTNLLICNRLSDYKSVKLIDFSRADVNFGKLSQKEIYYQKRNCSNLPFFCDKLINGQWFDVTWNEFAPFSFKTNRSSRKYDYYEMISLDSDDMNLFSTKLFQIGYKHIGFNDALQKQVTVLQVNLTQSVIEKEQFNNAQTNYIFYKGFKNLLTMSQPGFIDYFSFINNLQQNAPSQYFQPRMILGGLSMASLKPASVERKQSQFFDCLTQIVVNENHLVNSILLNLIQKQFLKRAFCIDHYFDFQFCFNNQSLIQFGCDTNQMTVPTMIVDYLQSLDIQVTEDLQGLMMQDLPQILQTLSLDINRFLHLEQYEIKKMGPQMNLESNLKHSILPRISSQTKQFLCLRPERLMSPEISLIQKTAQLQSNEKVLDLTPVQFVSLNFSLSDLKLKIDKLVNRNGKNLQLNYLNDKDTQVTDVLIAKLIGENSQNINFFSLSAIQKIIDRQFTETGQPIIKKLFITYVVFFLTFTQSIILRKNSEQEGYDGGYFNIGLYDFISILVQIFFIWLEIPEIKQHGFKDYLLNDSWNFADFFSFIAFLLHIITWWANITSLESKDVKTFDDFLQSITLLLSIVKLLQFLRFARSFQMLITMMVSVVSSIKPFLALYIFLIYCFTILYMVSDSDFSKEDYGNMSRFSRIFISTLRNSLGDISFIEMEEDPNKKSSALQKRQQYIIWFINLFVMSVITLNFLISEVGDAYQKIKEKGINLVYQIRAEQNLTAFRILAMFKPNNNINAIIIREPEDDQQSAGEIEKYQSQASKILQDLKEKSFSIISNQIQSNKTQPQILKQLESLQQYQTERDIYLNFKMQGIQNQTNEVEKQLREIKKMIQNYGQQQANSQGKQNQNSDSAQKNQKTIISPKNQPIQEK